MLSLSILEELGEPIGRFKYPDVKTFGEFIDALSSILDEARFTITRDNLKVAGMDSSKVAYIEVSIPREAFLEFDIESDRESIDMGFKLSTLCEITAGKKGNPVEFRVLLDKVIIMIEGTIPRRFVLPNFEVQAEVLEVKLEHDVSATILSDVLKKALRDIETVSDNVEIEAEENNITLRSTGEAGSKVSLTLTRDSAALINLNVRSPAKAKYDISYIRKVLNLTKVADTIDIGFSTDKPLELIFKSPDGSTVRYIIAPST